MFKNGKCCIAGQVIIKKNNYIYTPNKSVKVAKSNIQNLQTTEMKTTDGNLIYPLSGYALQKFIIA